MIISVTNWKICYFTFGLKDEVEEIGTSNTELKRMLRSVIIAVANIIYVQHRFDTIAIDEAQPDMQNQE